jgi:hypothetical protein
LLLLLLLPQLLRPNADLDVIELLFLWGWLTQVSFSGLTSGGDVVAWLRLCRGIHWLVEAHLWNIFELWTVRAFSYG